MKKILIATDFSSAAENAVAYGAQLAVSHQASIVLVNAFTLPVSTYDVIAPLATISEMQNYANESLSESAGRIIRVSGHDPGITLFSGLGSVFGIISECVNRFEADFVVMGIVGQAGTIKKQIIGSSALSAARNLQEPLMIIPEGVKYQPIRKISVACDPDDHSLPAFMQTAEKYAALFGAELDFISVTRTAEHTEVTSLANQEIFRTIKYPIVKLYSEHVATALREHLTLHQPDLVMINPKQYNVFKEFFKHGVTRELAFGLNIPILSVH